MEEIHKLSKKITQAKDSIGIVEKNVRFCEYQPTENRLRAALFVVQLVAAQYLQMASEFEQKFRNGALKAAGSVVVSALRKLVFFYFSRFFFVIHRATITQQMRFRWMKLSSPLTLHCFGHNLKPRRQMPPICFVYASMQ